MFFFPYKIDLDLNYIPFLTILICLICCGVFYQQYENEKLLNENAEWFCKGQESNLGFVLEHLNTGSSENTCITLLFGMHLAHSKEAFVNEMVYAARPVTGMDEENSRQFLAKKVNDFYRKFSAEAPEYLTQSLLYQPREWSISRMILAALAHADWLHLVANLIFFFAFAEAVETIIGALRFLLVCITLALGTHIAYSFATLALITPASSLGLSGVVMGMMTLLFFFLPRSDIRCLFWFIVFFKVIKVPAWLLALGYVGLDLYSLFFQDSQDGINVIAHISGAVIGILIGLIFFRKTRKEVFVLGV